MKNESSPPFFRRLEAQVISPGAVAELLRLLSESISRVRKHRNEAAYPLPEGRG
ncbi:Hypothetical protein Minf_1639 [Methylacidiphilum infernorum V4]|uniref:Uncharacterized protein n=1 Tax=Methylacidiphilum infernorum (isolate V4) TaxID=481448 RepID=B3DWN0_METI4|nr:Hypothetical protein Minf_1639 [Methylacidiphilum infernorum V4]